MESPIQWSDVMQAAPEAEAELAVGFFGARYDRATPAERDYMIAMADLGEGTDDLVQRTFLVCVEGRDRLRDDASFRSWLFGIAHNLLRKHFDARARSPIDRTAN